MSFKEQVAADIRNVFLNPAEFGEMHDLDGVECVCVVSGDATNTRQTEAKTLRLMNGIYGDFLTVCVAKDDLGHTPLQGKNFRVDGHLYKVDACTEDMGMLTIELGAYRMKR